MKRIALFSVCLFLLFFAAGSLLTPWAWDWTANNLQVSLHNQAHEEQQVGSFGMSAGWSRLSALLGGWVGMGGTSAWHDGKTTITTAYNLHIAGVSPGGVTVRVRYQEKWNGRDISFDKLIFVPSTGEARVEATPGIYITGTFE